MSGASPSSQSSKGPLLQMVPAQAANQPRTSHRQFIIMGLTTTLAVVALRARLEVEVAIEQLKKPGNLLRILLIFFCVDSDRVDAVCKSIERSGLNPIIRWSTPAEQRRVSVHTREASGSCIVEVSVSRDNRFATLFGGKRRLTKYACKIYFFKVWIICFLFAFVFV